VRSIIRKILLESIESQKIEVGDIFSTAERDVENKPLIMITDIIQDGKPGIKNAQTRWGTKQYESDGYSLNYKVSLDNGETWKYEDGEGHYVDTGWIGELVKMGHWSLLQKNINFFDGLNESEKNEENYDCVGINLSNLTTDEKIKVLEKLEQVYNTFVGFSRYAWVDQIQYLVTDFTTPVTVSLTLASLKGRIGKCGRYFTSVPENAYKEETDSYEIPVSMNGTKLKWSKEIDASEFLNMSFIDDTSKLFESEEDYEWLEDLGSEPFQNVLIKNNPRIPHLSDDIDIIMFNPPVAVGDKRFNKIAYWLEDEDYYPETLEEYNIKTSYIEITRHKDDRQNGRWKIGPELNEQELYNLSQTPKHESIIHPNWNGNFWEEEVLQVI
jgi:hypothetical protein